MKITFDKLTLDVDQDDLRALLGKELPEDVVQNRVGPVERLLELYNRKTVEALQELRAEQAVITRRAAAQEARQIDLANEMGLMRREKRKPKAK